MPCVKHIILIWEFMARVSVDCWRCMLKTARRTITFLLCRVPLAARFTVAAVQLCAKSRGVHTGRGILNGAAGVVRTAVDFCSQPHRHTQHHVHA